MKNLFRLVLLMAFIFAVKNPSNAQWVQCSSLTSSAVMAIGSKGSVLFAGTDGDGSYRSTDGGQSWTKMTNGLSNSTGYAFITLGSNLFLGNTGGIYRSTDDGLNWTTLGINTLVVRSFLFVDNVFLACGDGGIYVSADSGANWVRTDTSGVTVGYNFSLEVSNGTILDGSNGAGVWRSTDGGMHWSHSSTGLSNSLIESLAADGSLVYAGTSGGVYRSTDSGLSWGLISATNINARGMLLYGSRLYVATMYQGVIYTDDGGQNWHSANTGFVGTPTMNAFGVFGDNLFVGTYGSGIWWRPFLDITDVSENTGSLPRTVQLLQNYPNPFNPATTIEFYLPNSSFVTLKIFDSLGKEVVNLINESKSIGHHRIQFDASNLSSGIYFYELKANDFVNTKKLLLVK